MPTKRPRYTKKDYERVALALHYTLRAVDPDMDERVNAVEALTPMFQRDNPAFQVRRFYDAVMYGHVTRSSGGHRSPSPASLADKVLDVLRAIDMTPAHRMAVYDTLHTGAVLYPTN